MTCTVTVCETLNGNHHDSMLTSLRLPISLAALENAAGSASGSANASGAPTAAATASIRIRPARQAMNTGTTATRVHCLVPSAQAEERAGEQRPIIERGEHSADTQRAREQLFGMPAEPGADRQRTQHHQR